MQQEAKNLGAIRRKVDQFGVDQWEQREWQLWPAAESKAASPLPRLWKRAHSVCKLRRHLGPHEWPERLSVMQKEPTRGGLVPAPSSAGPIWPVRNSRSVSRHGPTAIQGT